MCAVCSIEVLHCSLELISRYLVEVEVEVEFGFEIDGKNEKHL